MRIALIIKKLIELIEIWGSVFKRFYFLSFLRVVKDACQMGFLGPLFIFFI